MSQAALDMVGKEFGRLTVLGIAERPKYLRCLCSCGTEKEIRFDHVKYERISSCGCLAREIKPALRHGLTDTRTHRVWANMLSRCFNPNLEQFKNYGGRGITVCENWHKSFESFLADMGECPSDDLTIERINNNGHYEPGNCKWATAKEQGSNKRNNHFLAYKGETKTIAEWSRHTGLAESTIKNRIFYLGWSIDEALSTKPDRKVRQDTHDIYAHKVGL